MTRYTYLYSLSGRIILEGEIKTGMIRFGFFGEDTITPRSYRTLLKINGTWIAKGNFHLGVGCSIRIEPNAVFRTGSNVRVSNQTKIICYQSISINDDNRIAWETQIIDTTFHWMRNKVTGELFPKHQPISIGKNNWIGNRCSIMKGTVTPDYCIVASNSLLNKAYVIPNYSMIAGSPAKLIKTDIYRCLDKEEAEIEKTL